MNVDVLNRLIAAARGASTALGNGTTDMDRLVAKNILDAVLAEAGIDAEFQKQHDPEFDGEVYDPEYDDDRLRSQLGKVFACMRDRNWRTLSEIQAYTGQPQASISAQLRHLRKPRFGSYIVEKRHRGDRERGLFEYRLLPPAGRPDVVVPDIADLKDVR